jgi:hypothetical protein
VGGTRQWLWVKWESVIALCRIDKSIE